MTFWSDLYRGETRLDFLDARRVWLSVSSMLLVLSLAAFGVRGFNLSVDFQGGSLVETPNPSGATVEEVRSALAELGLEGAKVQLVGGGEGVRVQTGTIAPELEDRLVDTVAAAAGAAVSDVSVDTVGPVWGAQITRQALQALVIFLAAVALYITWRFEWKMAATAMAALFHDLVITSGIYAATGLEVSPATVIAVLTILGYSLYDTVVVFDKVLENMHDIGERRPIGGIVNLSMNQVLARSINTSMTSLLPVGSLLFVGSFLLGAVTLREFALALLVGIGVGTYSSLFVASPILSLWKEREDRWRRVRQRMEEAEDAAPTPAGAGRSVSDRSRPPGGTGVTPRPPRQRRKKRR